MSFGELLVVFSVAIVALGPKQFVVIMRHFNNCVCIFHRGIEYIKNAYDEVSKLETLAQNIEKANRAERRAQGKQTLDTHE